MANCTLIVGGARSGKSTFALSMAEKEYAQRVFIATATAIDDEMKKRIEQHQEERGNGYETVEEEVHLVNAIKNVPEATEVIIIDCLTVWLGNLFFHCGDDQVAIKERVDKLVAFLPEISCDLILVTNEVGCGIVPNNDLARTFRDMCGYLNRGVAEKADTVYLCSCGIPVKLKG